MTWKLSRGASGIWLGRATLILAMLFSAGCGSQKKPGEALLGRWAIISSKAFAPILDDPRGFDSVEFLPGNHAIVTKDGTPNPVDYQILDEKRVQIESWVFDFNARGSTLTLGATVSPFFGGQAQHVSAIFIKR